MQHIGPEGRGSAGLTAAGARLTRLAARALVAAAAGVMAAGFFGWEAGALVAGLTALTYLILAALAPRAPIPYATGWLLQALRRRGYYIITMPNRARGPRYLALGPAGAYLLDTRSWRSPVTWSGTQWRLGEVPVRRVADGLAQRSAVIERRLRLRDLHPELILVPVLVVAARLPEPAMSAGDAVIARPRGAVDHIARSPQILAADEVDAAAAEVTDRLASRH